MSTGRRRAGWTGRPRTTGPPAWGDGSVACEVTARDAPLSAHARAEDVGTGRQVQGHLPAHLRLRRVRLPADQPLLATLRLCVRTQARSGTHTLPFAVCGVDCAGETLGRGG